MLARTVLSQILHSDALTRGLADPEARILVEWLVERAELLADEHDGNEEVIAPAVQRLCLRGRSIGRFVTLWCHERQRGAAIQLAAVERFSWPLPTDVAVDPCELMQTILDCEATIAA